jgi:outer membrane protein OmpA-like peptidoglycan-associated protein
VLIERGIASDRLSLAALGGTNPIVPFSDLVNRWKDRRVEFILVM